jgi:hypothetical protein
MVVARRVYLYGIAFATVWMLVNGLAGLLDVALQALVESAVGPSATIVTSNLRDRVSFDGALTGLGLVTWVIHWGLAARALRRAPVDEARSPLRKVYLYGFVLVGGLVLAYQLHRLLADVFGLIYGIVSAGDVAGGDVVSPLSMLLVVGVFWIYHLRVARRDQAIAAEIGAAATVRRWCSYILALVGLLMLLFGAAGLVERLIELAMPIDGNAVDSGRWLAFDLSGRIARVVTGLIVWLGAWTWTSRLFAQTGHPDRERDSVLRKVYLYAVLLIAVSWTVWNVAQALYVVLRSVLIPSQSGALWRTVQGDLGGMVANLAVFGIAWAYHARVVKREADAAPEQRRQAAIRWIYGYIVALVGGITFGIGFGGTLATLLDLLAQTGSTSDPNWWAERLSLYGTMILVGLPVWLIPWFRLQGEVVASVARRSLARRIYLFVVLGITVLTLLGSGAFTLYQLFRAALGEPWTASNTGDLIDAASAAIIAALMLAYHLRVFQRDAALARQDAATVPAVPTPLVAPEDSAEHAADGLVTLLIVRAPDGDANVRQRIQGVLPADARVSAVRMNTAEAERLLGAAQDADA